LVDEDGGQKLRFSGVPAIAVQLQRCFRSALRLEHSTMTTPKLAEVREEIGLKGVENQVEDHSKTRKRKHDVFDASAEVNGTQEKVKKERRKKNKEKQGAMDSSSRGRKPVLMRG